MLIPFKKLAFSLCAILLLSQNANAGWLDEVQKIQNALNQTHNKQGEQAEQNQVKQEEGQVQQQESQPQNQQEEQAQEVTPKFNSLAEEAAYKKQKQEQEEKQKLEAEQNLNKIVDAKIKKLKTMKRQFYKKYYVKDTDTPEMIDAKYKNSVQLFQDMTKDINACDDEQAQYAKIRPFGAENIETLADELSYKSTIKDDSGNIYLAGDYHDSFIISTLPNYEQYLKKAYSGYDDRQKEKENNLKQAQAAEIQRKKQSQDAILIQKERKKVEKICNAWIAKAHKQVYSLGIGDRILHNGVHYTIQQQNANTFLAYNPITGQLYLQKSECFPNPMPVAPSKYCQ